MTPGNRSQRVKGNPWFAWKPKKATSSPTVPEEQSQCHGPRSPHGWLLEA
ncbi:hypothetical protein VFPPC_17699 [Pochonia chlamydosporia 170]|uniref:Uncharacterized protein n=1 Tax=Pochonia chlamydosporia 170 TaxID=1380566 RepID=A0A219ASD2_METCM|nr:hypothetical protein VFPPC_17699 [Pochonia chlamydosporia 170]OWT43125.1 hypothetical protein VFPPC_17699 [Pochonia chlamydosporia 170]